MNKNKTGASSAGPLRADSSMQPSTSGSSDPALSIIAASTSVDIGQTEEKLQLSFPSRFSVPKSDQGTGRAQQGRKRKAAIAVLVTSPPVKKILQEKESLREQKELTIQKK